MSARDVEGGGSAISAPRKRPLERVPCARIAEVARRPDLLGALLSVAGVACWGSSDGLACDGELNLGETGSGAVAVGSEPLGSGVPAARERVTRWRFD